MTCLSIDGPECHDDGIEGAAPDWESLNRDLLCPLCDYNLRGLSEAKCPECGAEHAWADLLSPWRREHAYLFEHHPERNAWSFWRTLVGGMNPQAFWTTLSPLQPISLPRLLLYGAIVWGLAIGFFVLAIVGQHVARYQDSVASVVGLFGGAVGPPPPIFDQTMRTIASGEFLLACVMPLVWAGLTFLTFLLFGISMHRARVKRVHIARAVIYAYDAVLLLGMGHAVFAWLFVGLLWWTGDGAVWVGSSAAMLWLVTSIAAYYWLTCRAELRRKAWAGVIMWPIVTIAVVSGAIVVQCLTYGGAISVWTTSRVPVSEVVVLLAIAIAAGRLVAAVRQYLQFRHAVGVVVATQVITALAIPVGIIVCAFALGWF